MAASPFLKSPRGTEREGNRRSLPLRRTRGFHLCLPGDPKQRMLHLRQTSASSALFVEPRHTGTVTLSKSEFVPAVATPLYAGAGPPLSAGLFAEKVLPALACRRPCHGIREATPDHSVCRSRLPDSVSLFFLSPT